jgi:hypothetical protein
MRKNIKKNIVAVVLSVMFALNMGTFTEATEETTEETTVMPEDTGESGDGVLEVVEMVDEEAAASVESVDEKENDILEEVNEESILFNENLSKESVLGKVEVANYNFEKGTFRVVVSELPDTDKIKKVEIPVWSAVDGQDDIIWYNTKKDVYGNYYADINIKDHKYSMGVYNIHVYMTDTTNKLSFVGKAEHKLEVEKGELVVTKNSHKEYTVELKNVKLPGGISEIEFPTWSEVNGQDDIIWYKASKVGEGVYRCKLSVAEHKGLGVYNIHAYAKSPNGSLTGVGITGFSIDAPSIEKIAIKDYDADRGTFRIVLSEIINPELIKKIQIPTWSEVNGQDDIIWYDVKKDSKGNYYVDVDIKKHKYSLGVYNIHVYCTDITDDRFFAGKEQHNIKIEKGELTVVKNNDREYTVELKNVKIPGGISGIQLPTWSKVNGQDDIIWYDAVKGLDGTYRYKISVANHKGLGDYNIHAYAKSPNGSLTFVGAAGFKVEAPSIGKIEVSIVDKEKGQFQVKVSDIKNADLINEVQVPIWSEKNQGDIVWYKASKDREGNYIVNADIRKHKYNCGNYNIHVYMTDVTDLMQFVGAANCNMNIEHDSLEAKDMDGTESTYRITLSGLKVPSKEVKVQFAVWGSSGGQNDIHWYNAVRQQNGSYAYDMKIGDHKEFGEYNVHAYCATKGNVLQYIGKTNFTLVKKPMIAQVQASDINGTAGTFKVTISGAVAPSGINEIQVPVWCAENQSDIVWYKAVKSSDNTYTVNVKVSNHGHHFGNYKIHVYVTMGNGIQLYTGAALANVKASNYVYSALVSPSRREVGVLGANAERVRFPTWSSRNGQDDIVWYEGINRGNGKWNVVVDSANHKDIGEYLTHVYVVSNGTMSNVGAVSYSLTSAAEERLQRDVTAVYNQVGRDLYACYNWVVNTMTYQTINGHITPPAGYTREQWYAVMGLETHRGNCYCYAAAFAQLARYLGYNAEYVEGKVPRRGGGYTGHGWVVINGAYICDPEAQAEIGGRSFYMQPISRPVINYVR